MFLSVIEPTYQEGYDVRTFECARQRQLWTIARHHAGPRRALAAALRVGAQEECLIHSASLCVPSMFIAGSAARLALTEGGDDVEMRHYCRNQQL